MSLGLTNHGFVKDPLLVWSSILLKKSWYQTTTTFFYTGLQKHVLGLQMGQGHDQKVAVTKES